MSSFYCTLSTLLLMHVFFSLQRDFRLVIFPWGDVLVRNSQELFNCKN